jgi:hypothetical protein
MLVEPAFKRLGPWFLLVFLIHISWKWNWQTSDFAVPQDANHQQGNRQQAAQWQANRLMTSWNKQKYAV